MKLPSYYIEHLKKKLLKHVSDVKHLFYKRELKDIVFVRIRKKEQVNKDYRNELYSKLINKNPELENRLISIILILDSGFSIESVLLKMEKKIGSDDLQISDAKNKDWKKIKSTLSKIGISNLSDLMRLSENNVIEIYDL